MNSRTDPKARLRYRLGMPLRLMVALTPLALPRAVIRCGADLWVSASSGLAITDSAAA
ncbi:hypothetical protein [Asanoa iriomotensis]|nr:hypothetical protein [Asanoa iriomotensis]